MLGNIIAQRIIENRIADELSSDPAAKRLQLSGRVIEGLSRDFSRSPLVGLLARFFLSSRYEQLLDVVFDSEDEAIDETATEAMQWPPKPS